jgi:hypothetical protein
MASQLILSQEREDRAQHIHPTVEPFLQDWVRAKLWWIVVNLSRYFRSRRPHPMEQSYIPRKSHEEECRLEFLRFLHW